jgi:2-polyprenyl-3-methyl-5-hydroxy-6-metoxy-1,4-benzoquinol methylase
MLGVMSGAPHLLHDDRQRAYFDSADQPTMLPTESAYGRRHFHALIETAGLTPGARILEVGAGMGRFTRMFDEAGFRVVASDISPGQIASLGRDLPHVETIVSEAATLPPPAQLYDAVVGLFTLHHMPDLTAAFSSFARVVKPGGVVAFCEPNAFYLPFYLQILLTPRMSWSVEKGVANMRRGLFVPAAQAAGLEHLSFRHYGFFPPALYNTAIGRRVENVLDRLPLPDAARAFQIVTARRAGA